MKDKIQNPKVKKIIKYLKIINRVDLIPPFIMLIAQYDEMLLNIREEIRLLIELDLFLTKNKIPIDFYAIQAMYLYYLEQRGEDTFFYKKLFNVFNNNYKLKIDEYINNITKC